jgi:hypothetical protein
MSANNTRPKSAFVLVDAQRAYAGTSPVTVLNLLATLPAIREQMPIIHVFMGFGPPSDRVATAPPEAPSCCTRDHISRFLTTHYASYGRLVHEQEP